MVADAAPLSDVNASRPSRRPAATTTNGQPLDLLSPDTVAATPAPRTQVAEAAPVQSTPGNPAPPTSSSPPSATRRRAMADARRFTERFASVIGNTALEVHIVDLGAKGTWYRVLLPASSASAANTACANIKTAGGDCLIR